MKRAMLLAPAIVAPLLLACGGSGSLPEPAPCTSPTATPTSSRAQSSSGEFFRYTRTLADSTTRLNTLLTTFRATWPDNKFYRTSEFRESYVLYAGTAICLVSDIKAMKPPTSAAARLAEFDSNLDAVLTDYAAAFDDGTEAIKKRNTSGYRDWAKKMDALTVRLTEVLATAQQ